MVLLVLNYNSPWKGYLPVLMTSLTAIKIPDISSFIHSSQFKLWKGSTKPSGIPKQQDNTTYFNELVKDLKFPFKYFF